MIISFFEEYPTKKNLEKLKLVKWSTKLYLAAPNIKEFDKIKNTIKNKHIKEIIYWPILKKKEGYWFSPFAKRKAMKRSIEEIPANTSVMIDTELPRSPVLYITQLPLFFKNRSHIRNFIKTHKKTYTAEYYPEGKRKESIMHFFGLHHPKNNTIIKMMYHSMHHFNEQFITKEIQRGKKQWKNNFIPAFGTIAKGVQGNEPILSTTQLKKDLDIAKKAKIKEVIIFRLGGLNKNYAKLLVRYKR